VSEFTRETVVIRDTFSTELISNVKPLVKKHSKGEFQRMGLNYLTAKLKKCGFNRIEIHRNYSYLHYQWQFQNFGIASSMGLVDVYQSPFESEPIRRAPVNGHWVLMDFKEHIFLRGIGWVLKEDIRIKTNPRPSLFVRLIKRLIHPVFFEWYYNRTASEKHIREYTIIARR
jgi:hypothetical protein